MKKFFVIVCCLVLCLTFAACGNNNDENQIDNPSSSSNTVSTESTSSSNLMDLETYIASIQSEIDNVMAGLSDSGITLKVLARNNSLVYSYQYNMDFGDATEAVKESLDAALEAETETFEAVVAELEKYVANAGSVIVEYLDLSGNVITSKEYK